MFLRFLRFPLCAFIIHRQGVSCVKDVLKANKKNTPRSCLFVPCEIDLLPVGNGIGQIIPHMDKYRT